MPTVDLVQLEEITRRQQWFWSPRTLLTGMDELLRSFSRVGIEGHVVLVYGD